MKEAIKNTLEEMDIEEKLALKEKVEEELKELEEAGTRQLSPSDPDARMMKNHEGTRFAYNAQVAVDSKTGIILSQDVTNHTEDSKELTGMIDKTVENTGVRNDEITSTTDRSYGSGAELAKAEEKGYKVLVNVSKDEIKRLKSPFHQYNFTYDEENDSFVLMAGVWYFQVLARNRVLMMK